MNFEARLRFPSPPDAKANADFTTDFNRDNLFTLDSARIAEYARKYLSEDAPYFGNAQGVKTPADERVAICVNDPKFGYNFVRSLIKAGKELPFEIVEYSLCVAYDHLARRQLDPNLDAAIALAHPRNTTRCNLLKGLIMSLDISLPGIARWMHIPEDTVLLYCELFFNVRNCLREPGYIANLLYPKTLVDTFQEDHIENVDPGLVLMRAGYRYGADEVARLAGLEHKGSAKASTTELYDAFESSVMQNGINLARHGYLNSKSHPGVAHAKSVLAANRKAQEKSNQVADDVMGLGALSAGHSMGQGIMDIVKDLQAPDVEARRALQQQKFEQDARREKAAKAEQ